MAAPTTPAFTAEVLDGPVPVVRVRGDLDLSTAGRLCATLKPVARSRVAIDLTDVDFCDSTGLRALLGAVREIEIAGGRATLVVPPDGALDRVFALSGVGEFLRVARSRDEALDRLVPA